MDQHVEPGFTPFWKRASWREAMWANAVGTFVGGLALAITIAGILATGRYVTGDVIIGISTTALGILWVSRYVIGDPIKSMLSPADVPLTIRESIGWRMFVLSWIVLGVAVMALLTRLLWFSNH
jgi:hypothetical protein